ncbi:MAG: hypothetical protein WCI63_00265 [bacterium]
MTTITEAVSKHGDLWPYDKLVPLDQLQIGETIFVDFDLNSHPVSLPFTVSEIIQDATYPTLGFARGTIFEKCAKGQFEHGVVITYGRFPTMRLGKSRYIGP